MNFVFDSFDISSEEAELSHFFDGVLVSNSNIYTKKESKPLIDEIKQGVGQFVFVEIQKNIINKSIKITTDFMGMYEVFYFYCEQSARLIFSNSFRSLVDYYYKNIGSLTIDTNYVIPLILSNYNFFNLPFSSRTSALQIKRMPANKDIYFSKENGMRFINKINSVDFTNLSYDKLIERGVHNTSKKLSVISKLDCEKVIYMSGGKDSRASLSQLMYALPNKSFRVFSQDPKYFSGKAKENIEKDLIITNKLCLLLSLEKISKKSLGLLSKDYDLDAELDFDSAYNQWMNSFSNVKYKCKFSKYKRLENKDIFSVEFHGLAGEVYRSYWSDYFRRFSTFDKKIEKSNVSVKKDLQKFFYIFVKTKVVNRDLYEDAKRSLINEFFYYEGSNIYEKLDNHYLLFRNKYHFGGFVNKLKRGVLLFSPLIDYNYFLASRKQSFQEKQNGKLLFDIIDNTNPYLNLIPFDSSVWNKNLNSKLLFKNDILSLPDFIGMHSVESPSLEEDTNSKELNEDINMSFNYHKHATEKIINFVNYLCENEDSKVVFNKDVKDFIIDSIGNNEVHTSTVLGKVGSVVDIYQISDIVYEVNPLS